MNRAGGSPYPGGSFFKHRLTGARELRQRVRPIRAAPFLHRLSGALELPLAGSPFPGGSFFAEPQRGDSPSADGGNVAAPAAGAKRKGHLRFPFLFGLLPFPYFLIWRRLPTCDRFEITERQSGYSCVTFANLFAVHRQRTATHMGNSTQARHMRI